MNVLSNGNDCEGSVAENFELAVSRFSDTLRRTGSGMALSYRKTGSSDNGDLLGKTNVASI